MAIEHDKVDKFLLANESKFPDYEIPIHRLLDLPPEKEAILAKNHFKSPICMLSDCDADTDRPPDSVASQP